MPHARTTVVRPGDPTFAPALRLALLFATIKLALHVAANLWEAHIGYGYFRDEFYYLLCGRHLAWGYVDHGPIVAVQARLSELLFGRSLAGLRLLSALAGAARVFLTGLLAWSLGGRRAAQGLAMLGVVLAPQYLGVDSFLSMNSFESAFWMLCLLALILMLRGGSSKLWLLFGASAGVGLLNKPSMTFFLVALLLALLVTPQRRLLASRWAALGVVLLLALVTPNLLWQIHNHWPTLEFLRNDRAGNKSIQLAPVAFLLQQILNLNPATALIWIPGLVYLLRRSNDLRNDLRDNCDNRWLGLTYLLFLGLMMALHAKDYYVSPIYPILFAAGGIAWERRFAQSRRVLDGRAFAFPIYETVLLVSAIFILPLSLPLLPPAQWVRYTHATGLSHFNGNSETFSSGPLPQFFADRFGWQEEVDLVTRAYNSLPPEQRHITGILCSNYGQASAINFLGRGLPFAISRHNSYYLWGPHGYSFDSMILIENTTPEHLRAFYNSVTVIGRMDSSWAMPHERRNTIYLLQGLKVPATTIWNPQERVYF
jgi:Dolichyl-phosphate-mannose-protein mannosyltransferase